MGDCVPLVSQTKTALTTTSETAKYTSRHSPESALTSSGGEDKYSFSFLKASTHSSFHCNPWSFLSTLKNLWHLFEDREMNLDNAAI